MYDLMPSVGCVGVKVVVLKGFSCGRSLLATRLPGYTSCGTCMTSYRRLEQNYWETHIDRRSKDPKRLWTTFNGLLGRRSRARCEQTSTPFTADVFLEKITAKISSIRDATASAPPPVHLPTSH